MSKLREAILGAHGPAAAATLAQPGSSYQELPQVVTPSAARDSVFQTFHSWALKNYGDSGKTKTVTRKKYDRIVSILTGAEASSADNSKFRFWVKGKGFQLGDGKREEDKALYVPSREKGCQLAPVAERQYKRVAVVEDFFDIIFGVHVEMDGRGGKHAGQKRTYRAIAETYAFLPREAVTRFLMTCADCQKRMHISSPNESNNNYSHGNTTSRDPICMVAEGTEPPPVIDYSMPLTNTFLNHWRKKELQAAKTGGAGGSSVDDNFSYQADNEDSMSSVETVSADATLNRSGASPTLSDSTKRLSPDTSKIEPTELTSAEMPSENKADITPLEALNPLHVAAASAQSYHSALRDTGSVMNEDRGHPERKRRASSDSLGSSTKASESAADDCKDDDDDNEEEDEEKLRAQDIDPERLKAFNMFVRLFVDENLDRVVPISKQPKDKVQAILEACDRQFPEFHTRSRKRIRTYLKSCRRLRRSKDSNGWDPVRPTPPHLTSAAAETILAVACENEGSNAKRMRMGLEPLPVSTPPKKSPALNQSLSQAKAVTRPSSPIGQPLTATTADSVTPISVSSQPNIMPAAQTTLTNGLTKTGTEFHMRNKQPPALGVFRHPHEMPSPFLTNGNTLLRPTAMSFQQPAHLSPISSAFSHSNTSQNGPTDLSLKKAPSKPQQLNQNEVSTIKQLIAGYRESAAFLYRSADELEQLLLQQN